MVGVFATLLRRGTSPAPIGVRYAPPSGYSQSLRSAQPPIREFAALPPGSGFVSRPRRGIRNRCAIACPLAEAANTFRFCFAADCVRGYVARPSPLTQASLRRGCVAQLARFAGKTKPVKVLTLTGVGVAGFEPAASSSRTKHATKLRHTPCVLQPLNYTDEPKYQKSQPNQNTVPHHESHQKLRCAGKHRPDGPAATRAQGSRLSIQSTREYPRRLYRQHLSLPDG